MICDFPGKGPEAGRARPFGDIGYRSTVCAGASLGANEPMRV